LKSDQLHSLDSLQKLLYKLSGMPTLEYREYRYQCSGALYQGEWIGGFRHGRGAITWSDGARFEGEWVLGRAVGQGKFTHTKGEIYDGHWSNDKAHGFGIYVHNNGARYEGEW
jgi:hypothetical protein